MLGVASGTGLRRAYNAPSLRITDYEGRPFPDEKLPFRIVMDSGRPVEGVRHAIEHEDGRRVLLHINASPLWGTDGRVAGMVAALLDVTDSVKAKAALRQSETGFRSIVEASPMGVHMYRLEDDGRLVFSGANPAADRILDVDNRAFIGQTIEEAFPPVAATEIPERYREVARTGRGWRNEQVDYRDERIQGAYDVHVFRTAPTCIAVMFLDITDRKRAEQEVLRLNLELEQRVAGRTEQLEAVNRELESFCYSVSHDLRAPLRSMDGFSQILLEDHGESVDTAGKDALHRIRAGSQRMGRLIDDLLELSRVARQEMRRVPVDLSAITHEVVEELRQLYPSHPVRVRVEDGLNALGDPALLRVVLHNLLANAWKFTGQAEQPEVSLGHVDADDGHAFCVRDNGVGFDAAYADKIFQPFQRLHGAAEFEGTGVGLATVQRIVARHGGRVWAEGWPGGGAAVHFTLG